MRGAIANGEQLQLLRTMRGFTQEQLANAAGIDVKTIRKAEQGKRLDLGVLARLALALKTDLPAIIRSSGESEALQSHRQIVETWQAAWDARDQDAILALYCDDAVLRLPGGPQIPFSGEFRGKDEIRRANELAWSLARTVAQTPQDYRLILAADSVVLCGMRGLRLSDGSEVRMSNTHVFLFRNDLISEHNVDYDTLAFSQALQLPYLQMRGGNP